MDSEMTRLLCGGLAALLLAAIVLRRRGKASS
jgi:MYXO-CTERM domain-containing protein